MMVGRNVVVGQRHSDQSNDDQSLPTVYDLLSYDVPASDPNFAQPQRIAAYDNGNGRVVSNGSFSKLFGPGVSLER